MAAPDSVNVHNMNASYDMNKKISDSTGNMLKMQGLPWLVRQAANYSAVEVVLKQYKEADGVHLDQEQISTGNVKQLEPRILNGEEGERDIQFWGKVKGKNKYDFSPSYSAAAVCCEFLVMMVLTFGNV